MLILSIILELSMSFINKSVHLTATMLQGTKKRRLPTAEFSGRFNCKADFVRYFKDHRKYTALPANPGLV